MEANGDYPAWEYRTDSKLRETISEVYRELFEKEPYLRRFMQVLSAAFCPEKSVIWTACPLVRTTMIFTRQTSV